MTFLLTAIVNSTALAELGPAKIQLELRSEFVKESSNDESSINEENKEDEDMRFSVYYARISIRGKLNDELSYHFKLRLNESFTAKNDGLPDAVDYAYIDHKVSDFFKIRMGKQYINQGGWEGTYSSKNLYGIKKSNSENLQEFSDGRYRTGLGFLFNYGPHQFNLQLANNSFEEENAAAFIVGTQVIGSYMDGTLRPIFTYAKDTRTAQDPNGSAMKDLKASTIISMGVGLQYNRDSLKVELDYLTMEDEQKDRATNAADDDEKLKSTVLRTSYKIGKWTPIIKYVMDKHDIAGEDYSKTTSYTLAAEFKPWMNQSFHYFLSSSSAKVDYDKTYKNDITYSDIKLGFLAKF